MLLSQLLVQRCLLRESGVACHTEHNGMGPGVKWSSKRCDVYLLPHCHLLRSEHKPSLSGIYQPIHRKKSSIKLSPNDCHYQSNAKCQMLPKLLLRPNLVADRFLHFPFDIYICRWSPVVCPGLVLGGFRPFHLLHLTSHNRLAGSHTGPCSDIQESGRHLKGSDIPTLDGRIATLSMSFLITMALNRCTSSVQQEQ